MKKILRSLLVMMILLPVAVSAQYSRFARSGVIRYEKTANMYEIIKKRINKDNEAYMNAAFEEFQRNGEKFKKQQSTLTFNQDKILYTPSADATSSGGSFLAKDASAGQPNIVYTDLSGDSSICQKTVFDQVFLVKDSSRRITWKLTEETREIAGYTCRRANALIMDSVYVVAFYTINIPVSGGPESFTGLPGMILGVALPHYHITWFATAVEDKAIAPATITPPVKGKAMDAKGMNDALNNMIKGTDAYSGFSRISFGL